MTWRSPQPELAGCRYIAVTGYTGCEAIARGTAAGFEAHLTKPFDGGELLALIARPAIGDVRFPELAAS